VKRHLGWILRIVGGAALIVLVVSQIRFLDQYVGADGNEVRGRIRQTTAERLAFEDRSGSLRELSILGEVRFRLRVVNAEDRLGTPETVLRSTGGTALGSPIRIDQRVVLAIPPGGGDPVQIARADHPDARLRLRGDDPEGIALAEVLDLQPEIEEGLLTIGARLRWSLAIGSSFLFFVISWIGVWRWRFLLSTQGVRIRLSESFRLTYIGFFFNNVVPGLTGGDLVKAFYIARRSQGARAEAAVSVFVDRIIGLVGLACLGGGVLLFRLDEPAFRAAGLVIYIFLAATAVGGVAFFSRRVRRWTRLNRLLEVLPGAPGRILRKVDRAFFAYREHRGALVVAFLLSIVNHAGLMVMNIGFAWSLGIDEVPVSAYFVLIPVIMMISSIPLLPGGWGIGEFAYATFLGFVDVPFTQAIALSVVFRISNLLWSLLGGLFFITDRDRATQEQLEREARLEDEAMGVHRTSD
jgi:uncharacterized protein (TIRG00374 family)